MGNPRDLYDVGKRFANLRNLVFKNAENEEMARNLGEYIKWSNLQRHKATFSGCIPWCTGIPLEDETPAVKECVAIEGRQGDNYYPNAGGGCSRCFS